MNFHKNKKCLDSDCQIFDKKFLKFLYYFSSQFYKKKKNTSENTEISYQKSETQNQDDSYSYEKKSKKNQDNFEKEKSDFSNKNNDSSNQIDELTNDEIVVKYLKEHGELPDYYITKSEAKSLGWVPSKGNLCEVAPGRAIGGDIWTNRQKSLPTKSGRKYFEADLNYNCGNRNADRVVFSNDGLVFVTFDHYRSFEEK